VLFVFCTGSEVFIVFVAGFFLAQVNFRCGFCAVQSLPGLGGHRSLASQLRAQSFPCQAPVAILVPRSKSIFCAALLLEILAFMLGLGVRCWSGESTDQTLHSDLNIAAVIRVLLSQSGFAHPWIHCSALPSCCWRISLYCSYFSHCQDDVRDKTRKIRFFSCSQTVHTDDVSWRCSDSGFHRSPWRSAPAVAVLS
jgi:hypothetical protein